MVANRQGPYEWREYQNAAVAILFRDDIFVGEVREREGGWVSTSVESAGQKGISKPSRWHTQVAASKAEAQALTLNTAQAFFNDGPEGPELP